MKKIGNFIQFTLTLYIYIFIMYLKAYEPICLARRILYVDRGRYIGAIFGTVIFIRRKIERVLKILINHEK